MFRFLFRLFSFLLLGTIPTEFGLLQNLILLDLSRNTLAGLIPSQLSNMTRLNYINFRGNNLVGGCWPFRQQIFKCNIPASFLCTCDVKQQCNQRPCHNKTAASAFARSDSKVLSMYQSKRPDVRFGSRTTIADLLKEKSA